MGRAGSTGRAATPAERKKFERALRQVWASSDALDLPRLYGVGKFPKGRLKKGNAVHAISFHLGSWGGDSSLSLVSLAEQPHPPPPPRSSGSELGKGARALTDKTKTPPAKKF